MNKPLILRRHGFQMFQGWKLWLQIYLGIGAYLCVGALFYFNQESNPLTKTIFYVPIVHSFILFLSIRNMTQSKIEIDDFGLSHKSGLPVFLKPIYPDWHISWFEIKSVKSNRNYTLYRKLKPLSLHLMNRTVRVHPLEWVDPADVAKPWLSLTGSNKFENNALVKIFEARGLLKINKSKNKMIETHI